MMTDKELKKLCLENRLNILASRNKENDNVVKKLLRKLYKLSV